MIELPPASRSELLETFGCSRRLATRIGALLSNGVGVSALLLEEARPGSPLEALLLRKELLETEDPARTLSLLLAESDLRALAEEMPLIVTRQDDLAVIAAAEEELAASVFEESPPLPEVPGEESASDPDSPAGSLLPAHGPEESSPGVPAPSATASAPFNEQEVARLRVAIFAGATAQEKVAALRQFAYANVTGEERVRVFLEAAGDDDKALRAVAPAGLRRMGLPPDTAEALRLMAEGEPAEQGHAAERIADLARNADALELDAILMGLLGSVRDPHTPPVCLREVLATLAASAVRLGPDRLAREDVFRILLDRLPRADPRLLLQLRRALQAVDSLRPGWLARQLLDEILSTETTHYRSLLLELATALPLSPEQQAALIDVASETVLRVSADSEPSRAILQFLTSTGDPGLLALAGRLSEADTPHQRQIIRVIDNTLRRVSPSDATRRTLAEATLSVLLEGSRTVRLDILETFVCFRRDLPEALRERVTRAILNDFPHYAHWPHAQTLESALARLGAPAGRVLLETLAEEKKNPLAAPLVRALGSIGRELCSGASAESELESESDPALATEMLRRLHALAFGEPPFLDDLHVAMGRIASGPGISGEVAALIRRTLLERVMADRESPALIRALGWAVTSPTAEGQIVRTVADLAVQHLLAPQPEPTLDKTMVQGEEVFRVGGETDLYGRLVPACLDAVERLVTHPGTPEPLREELTDRLIGIWENTSSYEVMWSPADVARLTESLGRIGAEETTPTTLRVRIAMALRSRVVELPVLEALSRILARPESIPQINRLAGATALGILRLLSSRDRMRPEDREDYIRILARIAGRGHLEVRSGEAERLYLRIAETIGAGVSQGVPGALQYLIRLRDNSRLPQSTRETLESVIQRHTRLARRSS